MRIRHLLTLALAACQPAPASPGFASTPEPTTASTSADGPSSTGTTDEAEEADAAGSSVADSEPARDLGAAPDFGDGAPVGCKGKIDLLFVISRESNMEDLQDRLVAAFPKFIDTIESRFADFDYHIMVVYGDDGWGNPLCTDLCGNMDCKIGEACCPIADAERIGELCCVTQSYPCEQMDLLSGCDSMWGSGTIFPAGTDASNKPCPIDGGRRYLVKGQTDLKGTFQCIATVGRSGWGAVADAFVAAVQEPINAVGGCNKGFLRDDALLLVTFITATADVAGWDSTGWPAKWAKAAIEAKHGDIESIVMLSIFKSAAETSPDDRIGKLVEMFPFHHREDCAVPDYGPAFETATDLVETACAGFEPPK